MQELRCRGCCAGVAVQELRCRICGGGNTRGAGLDAVARTPEVAIVAVQEKTSAELICRKCMCVGDRSEFKSEGLNITKQTIPDRHVGAARLACHPGPVLTPAEVNEITASHITAHTCRWLLLLANIPQEMLTAAVLICGKCMAECAWLTVTAQILRVKD